MIWKRTVASVRRLHWLLGVAVILAAPGVARAGTVITVINNTDHDPGSLRSQIAASAPGDTIDFAPALTGQTIALTGGPLVVPHALAISGPGASSLAVSGNHVSRVFDVEAPFTDDVTISGLTITGGSFTGTGSPRGGAGVLFGTGDTLTLDGDAITGNQVSVVSAGSAGGAGVYVNGNQLIVTHTTITDNTASITSANGDSNGGGGLYNDNAGVTITESDISDNTVQQTATISSGSDGGGGIYSNGGDLDVTSSTVRGNSDNVDSSTGGFDGGGGIYVNGEELELSLEDSAIDGNSYGLAATTAGSNGGGGVYSNGGDATIDSSSIDGNSLNVSDSSSDGSDGGGAMFSHAGGVDATFSSLSKNTATVTANGNGNGGGAVFDDSSHNVYSTSTLADNVITLSGNGTQNNGGGALHSFGGGLISDLTMAGNSINGPGGGLFLAASAGSFHLKDTILASNGPDNCAGPGTFASAGNNLESANTCGLTGAGDLVNSDPRLGPLQNNGGPTLTEAVPAGSPAVDAGSCTDLAGEPLTTDQRGVARPQPVGGACDIGAYELESSGSGGSPPPLPEPPTAFPGHPTATSSTKASFSGSVNPQGQATTVFFQYGIDARYRPGAATGIVYDQSTPPQTLPADSKTHVVSASVRGLVPHALYHARLVATNATGTTLAADQTFTTLRDPAPPAPVLGRSINAKRVSGKVFILVGTKLVPLTELRKLRSGAVLDARNGSLQLITAATRGHKPQTGTFGGAVFELTQARAGANRGLTTLSLLEGGLAGAPSYATCKTHRAHDGSAAVLSSMTLQQLHANALGRFRTAGRYGAATVRRTKWTIADRCDGTLIRDATDSVVVTDFVRHRTVVLHAGQNYLARAPGRK